MHNGQLCLLYTTYTIEYRKKQTIFTKKVTQNKHKVQKKNFKRPVFKQ